MLDTAVQNDIEELWPKVRPEVAKTWPEMTRAELGRLAGEWDEVVTAIKLSTGETIATIEEKLEYVVTEARSAA
jgi:hypothetical protein